MVISPSKVIWKNLEFSMQLLFLQATLFLATFENRFLEAPENRAGFKNRGHLQRLLKIAALSTNAFLEWLGLDRFGPIKNTLVAENHFCSGASSFFSGEQSNTRETYLLVPGIWVRYWPCHQVSRTSHCLSDPARSSLSAANNPPATVFHSASCIRSSPVRRHPSRWTPGRSKTVVQVIL